MSVAVVLEEIEAGGYRLLTTFSSLLPELLSDIVCFIGKCFFRLVAYVDCVVEVAVHVINKGQIIIGMPVRRL